MNKTYILLALLIGITTALTAQRDFYHDHQFTQADTLRGMLRPQRTCYDVHYYALHLNIDPQQRHINGRVDIAYHHVSNFNQLQIDLYANMDIEKIVFQGKNLPFKRIKNAVFIDFPNLQKAGDKGSITVHYYGHPIVAKRAPWDGGFVWKKDSNGKPWVGVACEGDGASLWWPNKDHLSDEPDSVAINLTVPKGLMAISNGNLRSQTTQGQQTTFNWFVSYPINNYNVTMNIADYAHFQENYTAADGQILALDYYVLQENLTKAKKHFQQVPKMLECFEQYFDKYPFWNDGYALVETPYLGMEHQSAIAYGNKYMSGYLGGRMPANMDWDFIIIHETGHEYFGNSIGCNDLAEMWIHESFTTYMETMYVECRYDYETSLQYINSQRHYIANQQPIIGPMNVNWENWDHSDHYYKGAWMLHTLRHAINNDELWFDLLQSFYQKHAMSTIDTQAFIDAVNTATKKDYTPFFEQYLYHAKIPTLQYKLQQKGKHIIVEYKWDTAVDNFNMPVFITNKGKKIHLSPTTKWQTKKIKHSMVQEISFPTNLFLMETKKVL